MYREFVVLVSVAAFIGGIAAQQNASAESPAGTSDASQQQDHLALPSQNSYQRIGVPFGKYLPTVAPSYQVNSAVVDTISEATKDKIYFVKSYGSPNAQQKTVTVSASVAADPSSSEYKNILERYVPAVKPIKPYFSAPLEAKTVSIESEGANGQVQPVLYTSKAEQLGLYYAVPFTESAAESQTSVKVVPPSPQGSPPRPFYPASTAILESHEKFTVQSPAEAQVGQAQAVNPPQQQYIPNPKITYNVNPAVQTVLVPLTVPVSAPAAKHVEAYNSVQSHPPPAPRYAPAAIPVPVIYHQVQPQQPVAQQLALVPKAVASPAVTYVQVPVRGQVISAPAFTSGAADVRGQAISVPVLATGVTPDRGQAIPVPVYTTGTRLQYHPIPVLGGQQPGYVKAVQFSPASEVSRVIFNGLGVSYGW